MKIKTIIFLEFLLFISCNADRKQKSELVEKEIKVKTEKLLDTINADNYNVLFFKPNDSEYEKLLEKYGEDSGINEVDADFGFYINRVYDSLSKTDLKIKIVTERIIKLKMSDGTIFFDRINNEDGYYGIIFNQPNCEPRIESGVMTGIGILQMLSDYNKNCK